jgi:hypothetical protein
VFRFSPQLLSQTFLIPEGIQPDTIIHVYWSSCKVPVTLVRLLMKLENSRQVFEKYSNIKFHENLSSWNRVVPCGQTWRRYQSLFEILRTHIKNGNTEYILNAMFHTLLSNINVKFNLWHSESVWPYDSFKLCQTL